MIRFRFAAFFIATILLASCVGLGSTRGDYYRSDGDITTDHDEFRGNTTTSVTIAMHDLSRLLERSMRFSQTKSGTSSTYNLRVYIYATDWVFLDRVTFRIDGSFYDLEAANKDTNVRSGGYTEELVRFSIERDLIERIATADEVLVRFYGSGGYTDGTFDDADIAVIAEFLSKL